MKSFFSLLNDLFHMFVIYIYIMNEWVQKKRACAQCCPEQWWEIDTRQQPNIITVNSKMCTDVFFFFFVPNFISLCFYFPSAKSGLCNVECNRGHDLGLRTFVKKDGNVVNIILYIFSHLQSESQCKCHTTNTWSNWRGFFFFFSFALICHGWVQGWLSLRIIFNLD